MHKTHLISLGLWTTILMGLLLFYWHKLPPQIPLWYNAPWGQEQLAQTWWLWGIIIFLFSVGLLGEVLYLSLKQELILIQVILATSLVVQLILGLGLIRILWITL